MLCKSSKWLLSIALAMPVIVQAHDYTVDVRNTTKAQASFFNMGANVSPSGNTIEVNSTGLVIDGKPVLPVMGEFHFSRYPAAEWLGELRKMKAGGVNIVATYVFWNFHEEQEGVYDWSGQRNLRLFLEDCKVVGLPVVLRIGPWCHGETRNGGFPEWLLKRNLKLRRSDSVYLKEVRTWMAEIYRQAKGLLWKDGGPIIGMQLENEYRGDGAHILELKNIARDIGFDLPFYTRTGWPKLSHPIAFGEVLPLYGDYADGFWDRSLDEMPGDYGKSYVFRSFRNSTVIATEQLPKQSDKDNPDDVGYPYFTCELGGGMSPSYHRRIVIDPMDVYSMSLVRVGSGSNMPGYYVYHGGTNPDGKLTTLNESQASTYTNHNDLPVKTYDYQAPIGEFGQLRSHYHLLRKLHLFLNDFGGELSGMKAFFPEDAESNFRCDSLLRWAVRSDGTGGYIFVNNYQRLKTLSPKDGIRFTVNTADGALKFPQKSMTVKSGACYFMPFNIDLDGLRLFYATAQPIARLAYGDETLYVFARNEGVAPEFAFDMKKVAQVVASNVKPQYNADGKMIFTNVHTGLDTAICLRTKKDKTVTIVLLDEAESLSLWKMELAGRQRLFISKDGLTTNGDTLEIDCSTKPSVAIYPALASVVGKRKGMFTEYQPKTLATKTPKVKIEKVKDAQKRIVSMSKAKLAMQPEDSDFVNAAVWRVTLSETDADYLLNIDYTGDMARIYSGEKLLADNFYNGTTMAFGVKRFASDIKDKELLIKILPYQSSTPMYLPGKEKIKDGTANISSIRIVKRDLYKIIEHERQVK